MLYSVIMIVNASRTSIIVSEQEADEWLANHQLSWYDELRIVKNNPDDEVLLQPLTPKNTLDYQLFYRFGLGYNVDWEYIDKNLLKHKKYNFIARIPEPE